MKKWLGLVLVLLGAGGAYVYQKEHSRTLPEHIVQSNGRLELQRLDVASLYAGRVKAVLVDEGSEVQEGDVLAELSSDTSSSQLMAAQASEQQAKEVVQRAQAAAKQAREAVARAEAQIAAQRQQQKVAQMEWDNAKRLQQDALVSAAEEQRRRAARDGAVAAVKAAEAARAEALAAVGQAEAQIAEAQAGVARAKAQTQAAQSTESDMTICSPKAGRVEYKIAEVGNVVAAGSKVVSLLDPTDVSMNIFLPNGQMSGLKVGDEARIVLDGVAAVFPAKISFIATEAQFTPKAVETESERAKLMFKVKLKVPAQTAQQYNGLLKGGMTGNGFVRLNAANAWPAELAVQLPKVK